MLAWSRSLHRAPRNAKVGLCVCGGVIEAENFESSRVSKVPEFQRISKVSKVAMQKCFQSPSKLRIQKKLRKKCENSVKNANELRKNVEFRKFEVMIF